MLVLTRRVGEALYIDDAQIKITILGIDKGQVKVGIDAPKHMNIQREEIMGGHHEHKGNS